MSPIRPDPGPRPLAAILLAIVAGLAATVASAEERVSFPSLDLAAGAPVQLTADWFPAERKPAPAVALFHGCGGAYDRQGRLDRRMRAYTALLNAHGYGALVVDSLGPRGETELCTQRIGARRVNQAHRRADALAALAWLAARNDVEPTRIGMLGWSHGASAVLAATNLRQRDVAAAPARPAFAVAFYPGCAAELRRGYEAAADLLVLIGENDDWTPAEPCHRLVAAATGRKAEIEGYAGAYHGFDSAAPVRVRTDVPNGVHPGQGVHVGGNPEAARRSRERLLEFLARH